MMKILFPLISLLALVSSAAEVRRVILPERLERGNTSVVPLSPIDWAAWIAPAEARFTGQSDRPIRICYTSNSCKKVLASTAYATSVAMATGWRV